MDEYTPTKPHTTLVILLGASAWPRWQDLDASEAFAHSARGVRDYFLDPQKFHLPRENLLDLFDSDKSADDLDDAISQFLQSRIKEMREDNQPARDVLIYYIGHAGFAEGSFDYYLAIRRTRKSNPETSGVRIVSLAKTIKENTRQLRRIFILDCCYAAAAFHAFQIQGTEIEEVAITQTVDAFRGPRPPVNAQQNDWPTRGTALLCSSSRSKPSLLDQSYTVFSGALLQVLNTGDIRGYQYISLYRVADLIRDVLAEAQKEVPRPEVHSPDQSEGDVAGVPFFPNTPALPSTNSLPSSGQVLSAANSTHSSNLSSHSKRESMPSIESPMFQPSHRHISRRAIVGGIAGLAIVSIVGVGGAWFTLIRDQVLSSSHTTPPLGLSPIPPGARLFKFSGHTQQIRGITWSPDGKHIASGSYDNTVRVWDVAEDGKVYVYPGHFNAVYTVAWSPDGKRIASAGFDQTVQVWDAADGGNVYIYTGHSSTVRGVAWSPDSKRIASCDEQSVQVWDAADGGNVYHYRKHMNLIITVAWSPNGTRIASGSSDKTVQVWDAKDGGNVYVYHGHTNAVFSVAWSPDGKRIASGSGDKTVQVWDAKDGGNVYHYMNHTDSVISAVWSPDGKRIASGSGDKTVQVWDAKDGGNVYVYHGHIAAVYAVGWSRDGRLIASGGVDRTAQVWGAG